MTLTGTPSIVRVMIQRRKVIIGALGLAATAAAAGGSDDRAGAGKSDWIEPVADTQPPVVPVRLAVTPAHRTTGVSPLKPIVVRAEQGQLKSVHVTSGKT